MSVATCSHEDVNGGGADVNGCRLHPLITLHTKWGCYIWPPEWGVGVEGLSINECCREGEALLSKRKKGELWQHNKNTNIIVTNSNALLFGLSGSILSRTRDHCLTSLGVDGVGVRLAMV